MTEHSRFSRRNFIHFTSALGLGATVFPAALAQAAQDAQVITPETVENAEKIAGLTFTPEEREMMVDNLQNYREKYESLREIDIDNSVFPAITFNPILPGMTFPKEKTPFSHKIVRAVLPETEEELAFLPITHLSELIRTRRITSMELTKIYLKRLKEYDGKLFCVVNLTENRALELAGRADHEISSGRYRGPLHGIPWGAKDLLAVKGYPTTWGAATHRDQEIDLDATVVKRLDEAGAVLVAKLTLGALARGDTWFGGMTRNPWNTEQGARGSSAGPGSATAAGLVGFSIGSETYGSIISPSTRNGVTGLRPTYGRVSRYGAMALSWSMDKLGPMCRSAEDCAIVFNAIYGPDENDNTLIDLPFNYDQSVDIRDLRIGYAQKDFENDPASGRGRRAMVWDERALATLRSLGAELIPVDPPDEDINALSFILTAESGAAFDVLTRSNRDEELTLQTKPARPNSMRSSRFIPAVEYINANRVRTLYMRRMAEMMQEIDLYVSPSYRGMSSLLTNLTGHPALTIPSGFTDGTPVSLTFYGDLYKEAELLAVGRAFQEATDFHQKHPKL